MIPALLIGTDKYDIGKYFECKLPYFQENLYMMMVMGAIYGFIFVMKVRMLFVTTG